MVTSSPLCGQLRTTVVILIVSLGTAACDDDPSGPREEFPQKLYSIGFEGPAFDGGRFVGQDSWFAALGAEAASVVSSDVRAPKDGSRSLQVDGSRLDELQGFRFGSYARPLNYAPLRSGMPLVAIQGWVGLTGGQGATCGNGLGLTGVRRHDQGGTGGGALNEELIPNILIGIQARGNAYVPYLSNYDADIVYGPTYTVGEWLNVRAVLDFERRTVQGFVNGVSIGEVPFTRGIGDEILFMNISLGSSEPIPNVTSFFDGISVAAGPRSRR